MTIYLDKGKEKNKISSISFSCISNKFLNQDSYIKIRGSKSINFAKSIIEFHKFENEIEFNLKNKKRYK
jgi:hypothetical protein